MECHCCNKESSNPILCGGCHFAMYCGDACAQRDWDKNHGHHICRHKNMRSAKRVAVIKDDITSWEIKSQVDDFLESGKPHLNDDDLWYNVVNDLHVNGHLFQAYMKPILMTKAGRKSVLKKLDRGTVDVRDYRGRVKKYTDDQRKDIKIVIESNPSRYDPDETMTKWYNDQDY